MPKRDKPKGKGILYVRVATLTDLARYAYNFDFSSKSLILSRNSGQARLLALGESIKESVIAYFIDAEGEQSFVKYSFPSSADQRETARLSGAAEGSEKDYINIFAVDLGAFRELKAPGKDDVVQIKMGSAEDLVHATIKKSVREESFATLYAFEAKGKRFICGFDLIDELTDDRKTFYYAETKDKGKGGFAKYSYSSNTFEFAETVGEHSYIYIKIVRLAEPFPFFKMPD